MQDSPIDHWLAVRRAAVAYLKADGPLIGLVSVANIYGEQPKGKPEWPFVKLGLGITTPWTATGMRGSQHRLTWHAFAKGPFTDAIHTISAAIVQAMDGFTVPALNLVDLRWVGTNILHDTDEANAYHAVCEFDLIAVLSN